MRAKTIVKDLLLLFVGVSLGVALSDIVRPASATPHASTHLRAEQTEATEPRLVAYYFHGRFRCPTCRTIETLAHTAMQNEIDAGRVEWRVVDYDAAENKHFSDDFELFAPSVVLVREEQGKVTSWKNLERVWSLTDEPEEFAGYVHAELTAFQEPKP